MRANPKQREAIEYYAGPLMILAGAGSGKTGVITQKIAHTINYLEYKAQRILAVTFTNKAANEMKERLYALVDKKKLRGITISTFHAFCVKVLRIDGHHVGFQSNFTIYSSGDQLAMIKQIIVDMGISPDQLDPEAILNQISKAKNSLILPEQLENNRELQGISEIFIRIYSLYQKRLQAHQAMDFDDLLLYTILLFMGHEDVKNKYRRRFQCILVDEYQDTNYAQYKMLKILADNESNLTIVGDDDQSIYSWRGAESSNFSRFEKDFDPVKVIILDQNYRSTTNILLAADGVISKNLDRKAKKLWSNKGTGDPIYYYVFDNDEEEAEAIADLLFSEKFQRRAKYHDFAILFRTNFQSRPFETALREREIPYRLIGGLSFYDRKEVKDLVAYLKVIYNHEDDISLLRIINFPRRGIGESTIDELRKYAIENHWSLYQAMHEEGFLELLSAKPKTRIMEFTEMIEKFKVDFDTPRISSIIKGFIEYLEYEAAVFKQCKDEKEYQRKLSTINEFIKTMEGYEKKSLENPDEDGYPTLGGFLNSVSLLYDIPTKKDEEVEQDKVTLLTLHSAKGLEFPYVYMVGMEEGIVPHGNNENLDEERRLCYVGFTRAMKVLTLSSCMKRKRYGQVEDQTPSRFLDDIPKEILEIKDNEVNEPVEEEDAEDFFAQMKGMLDD